MNFEVERKFPVTGTRTIELQLVEMGASIADAVEQSDEYFSHPLRDFGQTDEALRIRRVGPSAWVTYKGPKVAPDHKTRRELELALSQPEPANAGFRELLLVLGFKPVVTVNKRRRVASVPWEGKTCQVALDEVDGLGSFVELELVADERGLPAAEACLTSLANELGLSGEERRSYLELILAG